MFQAPVTLAVLIALWQDTAALHQFRTPAPDDEIAAAEHRLGLRLPQSVQALYRFSNGLSLNDGNLTIHPLLEPDSVGSLVSMSDQVRKWGWRTPDEVLVFGANGSGEPYGLWTGRRNAWRFPEPIIHIGAIFEPGCMGLTAPSLLSFLLRETVLGLVLANQQHALLLHLAAYGLPEDGLPSSTEIDALLAMSPSADAQSAGRRLAALERWCLGGAMPDHDDPYRARLDGDALEALLN
ncbi:MAG: SMI1/KNR4 family protein [Acidobacteria bacterium]|nr:SMI1/KNR4 family protein [Acidobacteriota bacterium]